MSVMLHMARHGARNRPYYRIVASGKGSKRDGKFIELIGTYDPKFDPPRYTLKEEKVKKWITCGAQASAIVRSLIAKSLPGLIEDREKHQREKIIAARKKRKERARKAK